MITTLAVPVRYVSLKISMPSLAANNNSKLLSSAYFGERERRRLFLRIVIYLFSYLLLELFACTTDLVRAGFRPVSN